MLEKKDASAAALLTQVNDLKGAQEVDKTERKRKANSALTALAQSLNDPEAVTEIDAIYQLFNYVEGVPLDDRVIIVAQSVPQPDTDTTRLVIHGKFPLVSIGIQKHSKHPIHKSSGAWPTVASFNLGDEVETKNRHMMEAFSSTVEVLANNELVDQLNWIDSDSAKVAVEEAIQRTTNILAEKLK